MRSVVAHSQNSILWFSVATVATGQLWVCVQHTSGTATTNMLLYVCGFFFEEKPFLPPRMIIIIRAYPYLYRHSAASYCARCT